MARQDAAVRQVNLQECIEEIAELHPSIRLVRIFGSRRHNTKSVRSDIDLLISLDGEKLDYGLSKTVRRTEPFIDVFQLVRGKAISLANRSEISADDEEQLVQQLSAETVWSHEARWIGNKSFLWHDVLTHGRPEYTLALLEPGVADPAEVRADLLLVTALREEYDAFVDRLSKLASIDATKVEQGFQFVRTVRGLEQCIVVVNAWRMGPVTAALQTLLSIQRWAPDLVILAGITGGVKGRVELGDIILPDRIVEYEMGKLRPSGFEFRGTIRESDAEERVDVQQWVGFSEWRKLWGSKLPVARPAVELHTEAMASGAKVVADNETISKLDAISGKICSVEMEAVGVAEACFIAKTPFLVLKGVTDFADPTKSDDFHPTVCAAIADLVACLVDDGIIA